MICHDFHQREEEDMEQVHKGVPMLNHPASSCGNSALPHHTDAFTNTGFPPEVVSYERNERRRDMR